MNELAVTSGSTVVPTAATDDRTARDKAAQVERLRQFLQIDLPFDAAMAVVLLILYLWLGTNVLLVLSIACAINAALLVWASRLVSRGDLGMAITAIAAGILGIITCAAFLAPPAFPLLALITILPVAVALPFLERWAMARLMAVTTLASLIIAALGLRKEPFSLAGLPEWVIHVVLAGLVPVITAIIFVMLWQYSSRLNETITRLRAAYEEIRERKAREIEQALVQQDLARAREIQARLVPAPVGGWPGQLEMAARLQPARETSGDFYDLFELLPVSAAPPAAGRSASGFALHQPLDGLATSNGKAKPASLVPLQVAVGDVQGKGIGAALVMCLAQATLRTAAHECAFPIERRAFDSVATGEGGAPIPSATPSFSRVPSPATTLMQTGALLHRGVGMKDFVTCALAVVEPAHATASADVPAVDGSGDGLPRPVAHLRLANAAQVPPLLCRDGRALELVPEGQHLPLGILADPLFDELRVDLIPGDVVVFTTDGIAEAPALAPGAGVFGADRGALALPPAAGAGELFSFERLALSAAYWASRAPDAMGVLDGLWSDAMAWCGADSHHDDITVLVLRVPQ